MSRIGIYSNPNKKISWNRKFSDWRRGPSYSDNRGFRNQQRFSREDRQNKVTRLDKLESEFELLCGSHSVIAALSLGSREKFGRMFVQEGKEDYDTLIELAVKRPEVRCELVSKFHLDNNVTPSHRGVVLEALPIEIPSTTAEHEFWNRSTSGVRKVVLALDQVVDPQNLGAILRSACYFGVAAVVISRKNSAPLNATVSRASVGGMEVLSAHNRLWNINGPMPSFLKGLANNGWNVVGATSKTNTKGLCDVVDLHGDTVLVMGNEAYGMRTNIINECTAFVTIPNRTPMDSVSIVDSLNVSSACSVLLSQLQLSKKDD